MAGATAATGELAAKPDPHLREGKPSLGERVRDLGWLLALAFRAMPRAASVWLAAGVVQGVLTPLQLWAGGQLIGTIAAGSEGTATTSPWLWLAVLAAAQVASRFIDVARSYLEVTVIECGIPAVQARVYAQATAIDLDDFEHQGFYDATARIMEMLENRAIQILRDTQALFQSVPTLIGALILIFGIDWRLGLIALMPLVPDVILYYRTGMQIWSMLSDQTRERRLATYYAERMTDRRAAKEIRLFGLRPHLLAQWSRNYLVTRDELRRKRLRLALRTHGMSAITLSATLGGLIWLFFGMDLGLSTEEITILMASFLTLPNWVFSVALQAIALGEFSGVASDTRAFIERPAPFGSATATVGLRDRKPATASARCGGRLGATDLRFTYPGSARTIIDGISLDIPTGQRIAIVGENGAGKTTLLKLLLGIYAADAGTVTLDGVPIRDIPLAERQRRLSAVFQQFTRYPLTLAENITLGDSATADDLERVLAMAGMDEYVRQQANGAATLLAPDLGGVDLSGGQWQRLAIARAGYRDANVLALDEPTAALDPMAEVDIFRRFAQLAEGRTALLVSHRLGMARLADRIVVIEHGRVIEDGTHDELRQRDGQYAEMWAMQARWYV